MNPTAGNMSKFVQTCYVFNTRLTVIIKYPSTSSRILYIFALFVNVTLLFTTIFLNGITVVTIWKSRLLKEKTSNFTVMIQSFVDLANGMLYMTLSSVLLVADIIGSPSCIILYFTRFIGFLVFFYSMTALAVMSFERYMGILYPIVHRLKVTTGRLLKCFITVCCLQTVLLAAFICFEKRTLAEKFFGVNIILFLAFTTFVYVNILRSRIKNKRNDPGRRIMNIATDNSVSKKVRFLKELKIAKSCFLVVLSNLVCCLPTIIYFAILNPPPNFHVITVRKWLYILTMLNSTTNSLIFFWRNKELRTEGLKQMRISLNRAFEIRPVEEQN